MKTAANDTPRPSDPAPAGRLSRRAMLRRGAGGLFGFSAAIALDAVLLEPNLLTLHASEIPISQLPHAFDGYRIALIADIHYPHRMNPEFVRHAVSMANRHNPDLMVFAGDMTDHKGSPTVPNMSGLYDHAVARDGIVGTLGNHDHWLDAPGVRRELARRTPIRLIENESFQVERQGAALAIGGVGDHWEGIVDPERAFRGVDPKVPRILVAHNPDLAEEMRVLVRVDLQISGHMHGGQIYLPGYGGLLHPSRYGRKFCQGLVQGRSHRVYVTRGLFTTGRLRFLCPPAVSLLTLRSV